MAAQTSTTDCCCCLERPNQASMPSHAPPMHYPHQTCSFDLVYCLQVLGMWTRTSGMRLLRKTFRCSWVWPRSGTSASWATLPVPFCPTHRPFPSLPLTSSRYTQNWTTKCYTAAVVLYAPGWPTLVTSCLVCSPSILISPAADMHQLAELACQWSCCDSVTSFVGLL